MSRTILMSGGNTGIGLATARVGQARGDTSIAAARTAGALILPPVLDGFV